MNILSLDYGKKNIGLAMYNNLLIEPLLVIKNTSFKLILIKNIIFLKKPLLILIGFPSFFKKNIKSYIEIIFLIKKFIKDLINNFNIKLKIFDESYSSNFLENSLLKDSYSACIILNNYLKYKNIYRKVVGFEPTMYKTYLISS